MNYKSRNFLAFIICVSFLVAFSFAAIPNNTLQNGNLVIPNLNVTGTYQLGTMDVTDTLAYPYQPTDYVIAINGANYTAKNCTTGNIDYTGTIFSDIIQNCITALNSSDGGVIEIRRGTYDVTKTINGTGDITIRGRGIGSTVLQLAANVDMFHSYENANNYFFQIKDMTMLGKKATYNGSGVVLNQYAMDTTIENVFIKNFNHTGIRTDTGWGLIIDKVIIEFCEHYGLWLDKANHGKITNCKILSNFMGIYCDGSQNIITSNEIGNNDEHGLVLKNNYNVVSGNSFYGNGAVGVGYSIYIQSDENVITGNQFDGENTEPYNIAIQLSGHTNNVIFSNNYRRATTGTIYDKGLGTKISTTTLSFVDGTAMSTSAPYGWEIDAGGEYAIALGVIPAKAFESVRLKVYATANVTEADGMELSITVYCGGSNEVYTTETITLASHGSETTNFAQYDVIYWEIEDADEADMDDLRAGDQILVKIEHAAADGANCATDAVFSCIEFEYV